MFCWLRVRRLSTDAVKLAMRHNVDIVFLERDGDPLGRVWHAKLGSTTKIRKAATGGQLGPDGLRWIRAWLLAKLDQSDGLYTRSEKTPVATRRLSGR